MEQILYHHISTIEKKTDMQMCKLTTYLIKSSARFGKNDFLSIGARFHSTGLLKSSFISDDQDGITTSKLIENDCPKSKKNMVGQFCKGGDKNSPQPLSVFQLKNAFIGLAIGYTVSIVTFMFEMVSAKARTLGSQVVTCYLEKI